MRVLIADDHALIRAGLRALLQNVSVIHEVFEAGDGHEALEMAVLHRPEVILMDIAMPGMNGLQAMSHIRESNPRTRVIMLSMHASEEYVGRALHGGASGYLDKTTTLAELQHALVTVARGLTYVSPSLRPAPTGRPRNTTLDPLERLTLRHREVLKLIGQGLKTWEIAAALGIHAKTVESHRAELMNRLGIRSIAGLVRYAIRTGLLPAEQRATADAAAGGD